MHLDESFRKRESEARAFRPALIVRFHLPELLKDHFLVILSDANTVIDD